MDELEQRHEVKRWHVDLQCSNHVLEVNQYDEPRAGQALGSGGRL